ncbi:hypothetical protein K3495_g11404 [Podosphaera aphanis]|nr:hypothetical protein K3495_g11404 [Podosphaera aphanis]
MMNFSSPNSTAQSALSSILQKSTNMPLLHHKGSLKIGEVTRFTIVYTPSRDCVPQTPPVLYLRIKNTCAIALRAAYMRGPYNLYVAAYPAKYRPNEEFRDADTLGVPEFEPNLKAGGKWECMLKIPENIRTSEHNKIGKTVGDVSWIVEISSQIIFSDSAAVNYELLLGRDEKTVSVSSSDAGSHSISGIKDRHSRTTTLKGEEVLTPVNNSYSRALKVQIEDTQDLWNKPSFVGNCENEDRYRKGTGEPEVKRDTKSASSRGTNELLGFRQLKTKKVHLVVLTHGLHSNLGADMLYLKESIDTSVKQSKFLARERKRKLRENHQKYSSKSENASRESSVGQRIDNKCKAGEFGEQKQDGSDESEDEEVIVRGFPGNAARTERGIKYLGKRLARYVLGESEYDTYLNHENDERKSYKITSISFIAHSLGGLVQMYAIGYVQKHSPGFFEKIKPINFIALASPFLGLSNENPIYVKFALDFGLVGRTGQDLGLTWRAPTIARGGWGAIASSISENASRRDNLDNPPEAKPLLQILPTGPAYVAIRKFKNRTVYSNVVNDGIVPLRTSCLLFLDWQGLGRVEKAQRESGLVRQVAVWGWAEITGANTSTTKTDISSTNILAKARPEVTPSVSSTANDETEALADHPCSSEHHPIVTKFMKLFSPANLPDNTCHETKKKIYERSQILPPIYKTPDSLTPTSTKTAGNVTSTSIAAAGDVYHSSPPPKTSIFESAGDLLKPPLPSTEFLLNISSRPQTIFHDRIYQPSDIPPPYSKEKCPKKKINCPMLNRESHSVDSAQNEQLENSTEIPEKDSNPEAHLVPPNKPPSVQGKPIMNVEEKIARAYHRDVPWRKVLVRLEPDAHNNMIVRRMFANAYGWPVIKHLCDTHFSDSKSVTS